MSWCKKHEGLKWLKKVYTIKMRKPGDKGAPTKQDFIDSAKTAKLSGGGYVTTKGCGVIDSNRKKKTMIT